MLGRNLGTNITSAFLAVLAFGSAPAAHALTACATVTTTAAQQRETSRVPTNRANCRQAGTINAASAQVFNCRGGEKPDGGMNANTILLRPTGAPVQVLPVEDFSLSLNAMTLYDVNLGGGAVREHVLALWQAQQNGFGTNLWTLVVFDASWRLIETFQDVEDFGSHHLVQNGSACALAITKFAREEPTARVQPLYYQARFVGLANGRLTAAPGLRPLKRRYTNAFERQRIATFDRQPGVPKQGDLVAWMNERR